MSTDIRHQGRAYIRGKIRRVWRPRHLELCSNGLLRYYSINDTTEDDTSPDNIELLYTLQVHHARLLHDFGLPPGNFGFVFCGQHDKKEPRDFLCAVATLDQAQMWVVALQWAASTVVFDYTSSLHNNSNWLLIDALWKRPLEYSVTWDEVVNSSTCDGTTKSKKNNIITAINDNQGGNNNNDSLVNSDLTDSAVSSNKGTDNKNNITTTTSVYLQGIPTIKDNNNNGATLYIVTKATAWHLVRPWTSIAYEIKVLVLSSTTTAHSWSLLCTAKDLTSLVSQLCQELGPSLLEKVQLGVLRQQHDLQVSTVDSLLRSLLQTSVSEKAVVETKAMQKFLGITNNIMPGKSSIKNDYFTIPTSQWRIPILHHPNRTTKPTVVTVASPGLYIKKWLAVNNTTTSSIAVQAYLTVARRPVYTIGISTAAVWFWWHLQVPKATVRMDGLVLSWVGAAIVGAQFAKRGESSNNNDNYKSDDGQEQDNNSNSNTTEQQKLTNTTLPEATTQLHTTTIDNDDDSDGEETPSATVSPSMLTSPLPKYPDNNGKSCWSQPNANIFHVRGPNYLSDKVKVLSGAAPLTCRGVDIWMTDNPERHIARHPAMLGGKLKEQDTFLVNFLLPFGNFVAYFSIPPLEEFPEKLRSVWTKFLQGDQEYRDARLKLLPVVTKGPWIVKTAVGPGKSPALLGKVIPLQYYFSQGVYEVDVIITASTIAKSILSVVKGHTKSVSIAFSFIIEAALAEELPETVLCSFEVHSLHLEDCPTLPYCDLDKKGDGE